jgi:phosphoglycerate kinase
MFQNPSHKIENLRTISSVHPESLKGKKVIVRCDFNVPILEKDRILNTIRIDRSYKTINYLKNSGAKVILISHIGREKETSLKVVYKYISKTYELKFIDDIYNYQCKKTIDEMSDGEIVLFENIRKWEGETTNDIKFAKKLADFGDIFVNDAFSASHRDHASITGIPIYLRSYIGYQFENEILNISKVFQPLHPFLVLMGGAKFNTKMKMIEALEDKADNIFVGGALANDIFRAKGFEVGESVVSSLGEKQIQRLIDSGKISYPLDVIVINKYGFKQTKRPELLKSTEKIVDNGKLTFEDLKKKIHESKMIIWNGPFGWYEKGHNFLTRKIANEIAKSKAFSIVGGGDTVYEIVCCHDFKDFNFVSLSGGAMLEFIAKGTLPGIESIKNQ